MRDWRPSSPSCAGTTRPTVSRRETRNTRASSVPSSELRLSNVPRRRTGGWQSAHSQRAILAVDGAGGRPRVLISVAQLVPDDERRGSSRRCVPTLPAAGGRERWLEDHSGWRTKAGSSTGRPRCGTFHAGIGDRVEIHTLATSRRDASYAPRKVTRAAARIQARACRRSIAMLAAPDLEAEARLGLRRRTYVEAIVDLMVQQARTRRLRAVATGPLAHERSRAVRAGLSDRLGLEYQGTSWQIDERWNCRLDAEVDYLLGDPSKGDEGAGLEDEDEIRRAA